jgi:FdrA protein
MTSPPTTAGTTHVEVRTGAYADSVTLLQVSKDVAAVPGVENAQVAMATPLNLDVLASMGFDIPPTTPNDMVVALKLADDGDLAAALAAVEAALARKASSGGGQAEAEPHRTTYSALDDSDAELALVSVPGEHAFVEAMDALDAGRDVMVFSDNVPLDQEVLLKQRAAELGLLVMGPDCGTAVVGGVGLGFANRTVPGPVGLVAASGTGCQQLMCLLDAQGVGVTTALGVGGRDLSSEVGALSTREALRRLDEDPSVELIVVVSKPPAEDVAASLREYASSLTTPVQLALLGEGQPDLTAAAESALEALGKARHEWQTWGLGQASRVAGGGYLRGLFVGGTLCKESMLMAAAALGPVRSNIAHSADLALDSSLTAGSHTMVDFGDDTLTAGRAHPMIDPTLRLENLAQVAKDPATAVVLMDVVLGHGAEPDPAAALAPAIREAKETARAVGRELPVVVACVGTEEDPQQLSRQATALAEAGAEVFLSNAQATRRAIDLTGGTR